MICTPCSEAAIANADRLKEEPEGSGDWYPHPTKCECTCEHKRVGSWRGVKKESSSKS